MKTSLSSSGDFLPAGPVRALIERVHPAVDGGLFPAKRVVGEPIQVEAWVLADGHDTLSVRLAVRRRGGSEVREQPMRFRYNDEWLAEFTPGEIGFWEYRVTAWVDHFLTWRKGFQKKMDDGQNPEVELLIGANWLDGAAARARAAGLAEEADQLEQAARRLRDSALGLRERVELGLSEAVLEMAERHPDRAHAGHSPWVPLLIERTVAACGAWYEFFPRSWGEAPGQHGTFRSAQRVLPEIARMGFDIVYLPPIHPIGRTFRKGRDNALRAEPDDPGSPWAIGSEEGGHKAVNPRLGTMQDFQDFVWRAGELGLEVALDVAFQCSPDHPYVREHPQWFRWRPDGSVQYAENPPKKYQDILPFHFETDDWENLWRELKSIFEFWIAKGVKIFRVDNPHTKPLEFWRWLITEIKTVHPEVIFLAEAFTRPKIKYRLAKAGFTQGYTYFTWRNTKAELEQYLTELTAGEPAEFFWPNFWPNTPDILHDYLVHGGRPAHLVRLVLAATLSSNWGMYGPVFELAEREPFPGKEEYHHNEKYQLRWWNWDAPGHLKDHIARINRIRRENPALQRTRNLTFVPTDNPQLLAYLKSSPDGDNLILTVVNLDPHHTQAGWLDFPCDRAGIPWDRPFLVQDLLPEPQGEMPTANYLWQGARNFVQLDPHLQPAHLFRVFRQARREGDFEYWT